MMGDRMETVLDWLAVGIAYGMRGAFYLAVLGVVVYGVMTDPLVAVGIIGVVGIAGIIVWAFDRVGWL